MRPHVGTLSAFCSVSGHVLSFSAGPQRGGTRLCQGKCKHYKGVLRGPLTPNCGDLTVSTPHTVRECSGLCHRIPPRCPLHFSHRRCRNQEVEADI